LSRLIEMSAKHPLIADLRGRGFLLGAALVKDRESREPANEAADMVLYRSLAKGLSYKISMGNVLTLTPSLITTRKDMDFALNAIDESLRETERELGYT